jgi:branched-subunit amino acid transport protein AzlD
MIDREAEDAWRLYLGNWMPLLVMAQLLIVCLDLTDFSLKTGGLLFQMFGMA